MVPRARCSRSRRLPRTFVTEEEAYYWFVKDTDSARDSRSQKVFRIFLVA
jgi:hypothetical protein